MKIKSYKIYLLFLVLFGSSIQAQDSAIKNLRETSQAFANVARTVSPSVVFIQAESTMTKPTAPGFQTPFGDQSPFSDELFERFFGDRFRGFNLPREPNTRRGVSQGSGFVFLVKDKFFSDKSFILTNNHVVINADKIKLYLNDGREFDAEIVGTDPQSDIAVLSIKNVKLEPLKLGDSTELEVGEWVIAIGNPFGLSHTLTVGVVSAKGRTSLGINDYEDFIQTDAAINPGNSGGPLVNLEGEVIAMNTAIFTKSGGSMGIGFAIPINLIKNIADQLMNTGEVKRGYIGIIIQKLDQDLAESFGLKVNQGILVSQVMESSPGAKAGLRVGDVIIKYQEKPVTTVGGFRNLVASSSPGSQQKLIIMRDGKQKNVTISIDQLDPEKIAINSPKQSSEELGLRVQTLSSGLAKQFNLKQGTGVVVTNVKRGSIAEMAGIKTGTLILEVDRNPIKNAAEFYLAIEKTSADKKALLLIQRDNRQQYLVIRW